MMRCVLLLVSLGSALLALPAVATDTFVDWEFDRSAWEAAVSLADVETETFSSAIAQADVLDFDGGIESVASGAIGSPNHFVNGESFFGTLRPAASSTTGYLTFVWTFPQPVTAFGADFFSIAADRQVSVQGTFDSGLEAFDLRALFVADGGTGQGFFGLTSAEPFSSITLIALGTGTNDAFLIDNVSIELPEPTGSGFAALAVIALLRARRRRSRRH